MWKKFISVLFLCSPLFSEQTKYTYNPFTSKMDAITALSTSSIQAGSNITVSTTSSGVTISATSSGTGDAVLASTQVWTGGNTYQSTSTFNGVVGISTFTASSGTVTTLNVGNGGAFFNHVDVNNSGVMFRTADRSMNFYIRDFGTVGDSIITPGCDGVGSCIFDLSSVVTKPGIFNANQTYRFVTSDSSGYTSNYNLFGSTNAWTGGNTYRSSSTLAGAVVFSSNVVLNGSSGSAGQVFTTGVTGAPTWTTPSGGASSLAVATGTATSFTVPATSPTAVVNFNSSLFSSTLTGSATAYVTLVLSSVTALGSDIDLSGAEATGTLAAGRFPALTGDITTSAGSLATTAAALQANIVTLSFSSVTVSGATGLKVNSLTASQMVRTDASKVLVSSPTVNATTEFVGTLQAAQMPDLAGDLDGTAGSLSVSVTDDSHAHTSTTISGLDISADTNLTANNGVVLVGDNVSVSSVSLSSQTIGTLPVANGGTGTASTLTGLVRGSASAMTAAELSGDATTSGSNAVTLASSQANVRTFTSSITVTGAGGLNVTYGATLGSATVSSLTASQMVRTDGSKLLISSPTVNTSELVGVLAATQFPALTGDVTTTAGSLATTAASSQANIKTFTSSITVTGAGGILVTYGVSASTLTATTVLTVPNGTAPTVDASGEFAMDTNLWGTRGAYTGFDGTAQVAFPGILTSDTCTDGQVPKFQDASDTWTCENDADSGGSTAWDNIANPSIDGDVGFGGTSQDISANTDNVTAITQDVLSITMTNDAATDVLTQRILVLENVASTNGVENALVINNADTDDVMTTAIGITSEAGAITTAIDVSDADIVTALTTGGNIVTGTAYYITGSSLTVSGQTAIAGAINISTTVHISGTPGTSGQVLTSGGAGAVISWTTPTTGDITSVLAGTGMTGGGTSGDVTITAASTTSYTSSTQTVTAGKTYQSSSTFNGAIVISTSVIISASNGTSGQFLTSGGAGAAVSWSSETGDISGVSAGTGLTGGGTSGAVTLTIASTAAFTTSTQTFSAGQTFTSSTTHNGAVLISTSIALNGSVGTNGQVATSGGPGAVVTWTTIAGGGDAVLASTQNWTGGNTFKSSTTFTGEIVISTSISIGASDGTSGQVLTSGGAGVSVSWTTPPTYHKFLPEDAQFLTTNFPQIEISTFTNFPISSLNYDASTSTETAHWKFVADDFVSGNLTLSIFWYADTASSGDVVWSAAVACVTANTDSGNIQAPTGKAYGSFNTATDSHLGTNGKRAHQIDLTISNTDSIADNDLCWIEIGRSGANAADTMTGDANLLYAQISY